MDLGRGAWWVGLASVVVLALWLADALGATLSGASLLGARLAVLAAGGASVALAVRAAYRLWRQGGAARWLVVLALLALVLCFLGLGHESASRDFGDEGIYRAQAERINQEGQLLKPWFIYPHLLFFLDALALWIASLFGPAVATLSRELYGISGALPVAVLVTRSVTALPGGLTVAPVFIGARRLAGDRAAVAAGALVALSPLWIEIAHLNLSDVVGGFFAAMTVMQVTALIERERTRDYLLAGTWAGLAAGGKYPAGVVAVAIAGAWLLCRVRPRTADGSAAGRDAIARNATWSARAGIVWAAAAALAAFLATTPSLLAYPAAALGLHGGGADLFFGVRQYSARGWTGVVHQSNALYYLQQLVRAFGVPALVAGTVGIGLLPGRNRRRVVALLPFPVVYLGLLLSMEMAVRRNLLPVLPVVAMLLGAGLAGAWGRVAGSVESDRRDGRDRRGLPDKARPRSRRVRIAWAMAAALLILGPPAGRSATQAVRFVQPTTREVAAAWMETHLPPGSFLVREAYTPRPGPSWRFPSRNPRFAIRLTQDELRDPRNDFLLLAAGSYRRFLDPHNLDDPVLASGRRRYQEIFRDFDLVHRWRDGRFRAGPEIRLYRLDPANPPYATAARFGPGDALLRSPAMATGRPSASAPPGTNAIIYTKTGQWSLYKPFLEAGSYQVTLATRAPSGQVEVRDRANRLLASAAFVGAPVVSVRLPERQKVFLYVTLPPGSSLSAVAVEPAPAP